MIPATPAKSTPSSAVEPPGLVMHPPEEPLLLDVLTVLPDPASVFPPLPALDVEVTPLPEPSLELVGELLTAEPDPVPVPPSPGASQRRHGELLVPQGPACPASQS